MTSRPETLVSDEKSVRQRLIDAAIELFGSKGTQVVSLREVTRHANVLNNGAIRYYFGDREDLLEAAVQHVCELLQPNFEAAWEEFDDIDAPSVRDAVGYTFGAIVDFYFSHSLGSNAIRLLSRLVNEEGDFGERLLIQYFGAVIWKIEEIVQALIPAKPATELRIHVLFAIDHALTALPHMKFIYRLPDPVRSNEMLQLTSDQHFNLFVDYLAAAIQA